MGYEDILQKELEGLDLSEIDKLAGNLDLPSVADIITDTLEGKSVFQSDVIIKNLLDLLIFELKSSIMLGAEIIAVCMIVGLLRSFSNSFGEETVSKLAVLVSGCLIIALCLNNFTYTYQLCIDTVSTMTRIMQILLPALLPLLIATGGFTGGSILNPVILGVITLFNTAMNSFILPAVFLSAIFTLINSLTERDYVSKLAHLLRAGSIFATGAAMTIFIGIVAVQGAVTDAADGVLVRTARFSIGNLIPIVGGFAADSLDMVMSCMGMIKSGIGIFGVLAIVTVLSVPIIKLAAIALIYKLTAAAIEPLGDEKVTDCMNEMGNAVMILAVLMFLTALMFLIFISMIIGFGGSSLL